MMANHGVQFCTILNNHGVEQLLNRRYDDAAKSFSKALRLAKRELTLLHWQNKLTEPMDADVETRNEGPGPVQGPTHCRLRNGIEPPILRSSVDIKDDVVGEGMFLYQAPLRIPESSKMHDYKSIVEISVAVMFNLALSHHLHGFDRQFKDTGALQQAVALYELAYSLQVQEDLDVSVETTMAIINNLGFIHRELENQEKASQCFQHLLSTILFVQSLENNDFCQKTEGFLRNVTHLILKEAVAPAA